MNITHRRKKPAQSILMLALTITLVGCMSLQNTPTPIGTASAAVADLSKYGFPTVVDSKAHYLFYLHGQIIEDQGLPAISPQYGQYQYAEILNELASHGFVVISEPRPKNTVSVDYAAKLIDQITYLVGAGVSPDSISVVGASKGAGIAAMVSSMLKNQQVNFILLGYCSADEIQQIQQHSMPLYGDVLAIRDASDDLSGSCSKLFSYSEGKGIGAHEEILLHLGTGHGILYQPMEEWVLPVVQWAWNAQEAGLALQEVATLSTLKLVDDYPLYTMDYRSAYDVLAAENHLSLPLAAAAIPPQDACNRTWGCSLFAALGDEGDRLYGRNFDWQFSPALLLFTDPPDGYASVSMVDIEYLGFRGEASKDLMQLPLDQLRPLLEAPNLPFDGMNEKGLAIGMAAVPEQEMPWDANRETLDELQVIREILDHAATVPEAVDILDSYNIDMGSVPVHYLVASASGDSALVEFYQGEMKVFRSAEPWQAATNFLFAFVDGSAQGQCWRYDLISRRLEESKGRLSPEQALALLAESSQESTQWSVVYRMTLGEVEVVMGMKYSDEAHIFKLNPTER